MPARRRRESSTKFYHVMVKGINKERIFDQQREKMYFRKIICKYLSKYEAEIYAYCIMSNHAHFIIRAEIQILSMFMALILAEYARYYNFKHNRNGHVFQNRFSSECIETEAYYWNCVRYIHMNPVKANMVNNPLKYKYGSMAEYMLEETRIIHSHALGKYREVFRDYEEFEIFHMKRHTQVFADLREEMEKQREEAAYVLAEEMFEHKQLKQILQVFEENQLREEYIDGLVSTLNISKHKATQLCMKTMNNVQNQ